MTQNKSFTLIELLVALTVFSIIMAAVAGIFISGLRAQKLILAKRELLDQTSYLMEYTSRAMRMAKKDLDGSCITTKKNYELTRGENGIKFEKFDFGTQQVICQEFFRDTTTNRLMENKAGVELPLTSGALSVEAFKIAGTGWDQEDNLQPRATFFLSIKTKPEMAKIRIQTTISQRALDVTK